MNQEVHAILNEHTKILNEHTKHLKKIDKTLEEHTKHLKKIDEILEEHTQELKEIKRMLVVIEDAVTNKIPALFDAFSMVSTKQEEQEQKVNYLEEKLENHSMRITALEIISSQN